MYFRPSALPPEAAVWRGCGLRLVETAIRGLDTSGPAFDLARRRLLTRRPAPVEAAHAGFSHMQDILRLVAITEDDDVVGQVECRLATHGLSGELGVVLSYAISPHWWGSGLGTMVTAHGAVAAIERFTEARSVWAEIYPENERSVRVARRLGLELAHMGLENLMVLGADVHRCKAACMNEIATSPLVDGDVQASEPELAERCIA